jgi:hypothetical protein
MPKQIRRPVRSEQARAIAPRIAADRIEDQVDAASVAEPRDLLLVVLRVVVDRVRVRPRARTKSCLDADAVPKVSTRR